MPSGKSYDKVLAEAEQMVRVWEANPDFSMGELTLAQLRAQIQELRDKRAAVEETKTLRTRLVNEADDGATALTKLSARIRSGIKAQYGPNSSQYEQAQGTRESERKTRTSGGSSKQSAS
jgi:hypothetical protein